jgi:arsenite-transporting ATPase
MESGRFPTDLLERRIHLVTGKGGVGRTTTAAAMARLAAAGGKRVLLCEIGDPDGGPSSVGACFGKPDLGPDPQPLGPPGLFGCLVWATRGHELFAHQVIPAGPLIRTALRSETLRKFVAAVPSLYELGVFYHLLRLLQETDAHGNPVHEIVVADMPATGQTLALTSLPAVLLDALPDGPIPRYMREGQAYLNDPEKCLAWVVALPEPLPVTEAIELVEGLAQTQVTTGAIILNRVPADPFSPAQREALKPLLAARALHGARAFHQAEAVGAARAQIAEAMSLPVVQAPLLPRSQMVTTAEVAAALAKGWAS